MLALEFYKLRRKRILVMMTLFLGVQLIWMLMSISIYMSRNTSNASWETILVMAGSINGLFLPLMSAIAISRVCDMEHKGNTWKLLIPVAVKRSRLYLAKYACANLLLLYYVLLQAGVMVAFGLVKDFAGLVPIRLLLAFLGGTILVNLAVSALQQWISLAVRNQAFALCLGMVGGFIGMAASFFPEPVRRFLIWSYYTGLNPVQMVYTGQTAQYELHSIHVGLLLAVGMVSVILYLAGSLQVSRQDM
ncbi:ABC transporter permease [Paenibacillus filicis]|uniref:ABC transporter permease n=1 Tax=Paenibacillus filicis TaxID=669464 RepID=A0ABU9DST7_9BACL